MTIPVTIEGIAPRLRAPLLMWLRRDTEIYIKSVQGIFILTLRLL
jgi:hypothetical protein